MIMRKTKIFLYKIWRLSIEFVCNLLRWVAFGSKSPNLTHASLIKSKRISYFIASILVQFISPLFRARLFFAPFAIDPSTDAKAKNWVEA